jgi:hypothetical protein
LGRKESTVFCDTPANLPKFCKWRYHPLHGGRNRAAAEAERGLDLLIIDYLQLIEVTGRTDGHSSRHDDHSELLEMHVQRCSGANVQIGDHDPARAVREAPSGAGTLLEEDPRSMNLIGSDKM